MGGGGEGGDGGECEGEEVVVCEGEEVVVVSVREGGGGECEEVVVMSARRRWWVLVTNRYGFASFAALLACSRRSGCSAWREIKKVCVCA